MYDVAIIGTGPAGLSAALTLKLHNKNIIWFGSQDLSQKVEKSEKIANYPGCSFISGHDLNQRFKEQIQEAELEITDKMVTMINPTKKGFMILGDNDIFEAKTVLIASGAVTAKGYDREEELLGRGISYCATCDGFLYRGKTIGVVCSAKRFEHEISYLADLAEKVYLFPYYKDCSVELDNVEIRMKKIEGFAEGNQLTGVVLAGEEMLPMDGLFILRDAVAPSTLVNGLEMDGPHIVVNRKMETNIKACFAAGDCTGVPYQLTKATGEGNVAAHSIIEYLASVEE